MEQILTVESLETSFFTHAGEVKAVRGISFGVGKGETLGIVGESGSGKSVTSLSIMRLLQENGKIVGGKILFQGEDLVVAPKKQIRSIRGGKISMIFQDPMTSLNPLMTVGNQVREALLEHNPDMSKAQAKDEVLRLFELVKIPDPENRYKAYPHELSGGMRQRIVIAMALSCKPELVIADEPTTALDVTIQDQILKLLQSLQDELQMSVLFITHDLGVVAELCDRVIVMYGGMIMEEGLSDELFFNPSHPYTMGLLSCIPKMEQDKSQQLDPIAGSPPDMLNPPKGCPFYPRCAYARTICAQHMPPFKQLSDTHKSLCWLLDDDAPAEGNPFKGKGGMQDG